MCRLAAYLGPETSLKHIVFDTDHSLEKQAWQPRELREAKLNADGFGFGWFNANDTKHLQIARYREVLPIWSDPNLVSLCDSITRPLWLCYIRSATAGIGISPENTQPFCGHGWQFLHNGYINNFQATIRGNIRQLISAEIEALIHGGSDSEYLFALILHFYLQSADMTTAIGECFSQLHDWLGSERALLNVLLSDGDQIIATSHAINGLCPSLYYGKDIAGFPEHSQLIVSEKLNDDANWQAVPEHHIVTLRDGIAAEIKPL